MIQSNQPVLTNLIFWGALAGSVVLTYIAVFLSFVVLDLNFVPTLVILGLLVLGAVAAGVLLIRGNSPALGWGLIVGVVVALVSLVLIVGGLVLWYADFINKNF
jgi:hypothetical protein